MKKIILLFVSVLVSLTTKAQTQNPVTWQATYKSISATEGEISITATIEKGWHTYSQKESTAGPIPTSFKYNVSKDFELVGKTSESNAHEEYDKAFDAKIFIISGNAEFKQKIKVKMKGGAISIKVDYMCCNDAMCLPPKTVDLSVKVQ